MKRILLGFAAFVATALCIAQTTGDPWPAADVVQPDALAAVVAKAKAPIVISVAFPVLYRNKHIVHALDAGAGSKPEGIAALKALVATAPKSAEIVIYCGCCPMEKCPNIRPAYSALKSMGFEHVRVLSIPTNMSADWYSHGYPSEPGTAR
jgi:thiosulfate/3-mercaptopyruvate sulfurtransferase